jgi:two-component system response regulator HydG
VRVSVQPGLLNGSSPGVFNIDQTAGGSIAIVTRIATVTDSAALPPVNHQSSPERSGTRAGSAPTLLAIDGVPAVLAAVAGFAQGFGFRVVTRTNPRAALAELPALKPDAVMVDMVMPDVNGLDVLRAIRQRDPSCQVVLMTGHPSVDTALEALKLGALDYISKPFDFARLGGLLTGVRKGIERRQRLLETDAEVARTFAFAGMIGRSPAMQELFDTIRRLAPHVVRTVLVTGESGTGKELVARALHKIGARRDRRFVTVNCSSDTPVERELFGHQRGAFTGATDTKAGLFEHADKGSLFLDEIGEMPLAVQAGLLRAVEHGEVQRVGSLEARRVDVAMIAATNRDLRAEAAAGRFRTDLYYRLGAMEIRLPPLRDHPEDVPYLAAAFIRDVSERLQRAVPGMTAAAERTLQRAPWPGNVRELRRVIERACLLSDGRMLSERDVMAAMPPGTGARPPAIAEPSSVAAIGSAFDPDVLTTTQRLQLQQALLEAHGNKAAAARRLGISRRSMYRWLDRFHLSEPRAGTVKD